MSSNEQCPLCGKNVAQARDQIGCTDCQLICFAPHKWNTRTPNHKQMCNELAEALQRILNKENIESHGWYADEFANAAVLLSRFNAIKGGV